MRKPTIHLVCNAHIDPVWQWEWEEGVSATLVTFRTAADLCEEAEDFTFNHNEALLYKWVEEHDPKLFERIQRLVKAGKWHIMGGWYLQPDCNMPSGEGLVRQILAGREYFQKKFDVRPTTAINFDPFGHSRGLVQILAKSGYDSYIHCRPRKAESALKADDYIWIGYDGSEIICTRPQSWYNSPLGKAGEKLNARLKEIPCLGVSLMLWGVGNHGGGPSRKDIQDIKEIITREKNWTIHHSTPEAYFRDLKQHRDKLTRWSKDLNPWAVGCYSSMIRIKQGYRAMENALFVAEKMAATAAAQNLMPYPGTQLKAAEEDMLWTAFHDVLPGSSTAPVEKHALYKIGHGMALLSQIKAKAFFCLTKGQSPAKTDTFPVFVYNPHSWEIQTTITAEFNLPDVIQCPDTFWVPDLLYEGGRLPIQAERPNSNMPMDWRKRICFKATLAPGVMNRFDIILTRKSKRPLIKNREQNGIIRLRGKGVDWAINTHSGLIEHLRFSGKDVVRKNAFKALVINDSADPWGMTTDKFDSVIGQFRLLSAAKSAEVSGVPTKNLKPVRIVEQGSVRTVVEALYGYNDSYLILTWKLPKEGTEIELEARVFWNEKDKLLKLSVPTVLQKPVYMGDVAYGREILPATGRELVAQKWTAVVSERNDLAMTFVNDGTYASSFTNGEMRLTLLRSPAYAAHPVSDWPIVPDNMFRPRIDQGERIFTFWLNAGSVDERMDAIAREAQIHNEKPMIQWFSPSRRGDRSKPFAVLSNKKVVISTLKQAEDRQAWIIRLFEPTGKRQKTELHIPVSHRSIHKTVTLQPFEIKTLRVDTNLGTVIETDLMEQVE